jgi:hypothetical protein
MAPPVAEPLSIYRVLGVGLMTGVAALFCAATGGVLADEQWSY